MIHSVFLKKFKYIHFIGIGGISMSALAKLCISQGIFVSGTDKVESNITQELQHLGATIFIGHKKNNVTDPDLVVYTCAVGKDNIELLEAQKKGILLLERAEFLGEITKSYKNVVAISGSHGKTTVASMVASIFEQAKLNPTVLIGGETSFGNLKIGGDNYLIVEACEYQEHFLKLKHDVGVVLNIDYDHPDYFKSDFEYQNCFKKFANLSKEINIVNENYKMFLDNKNLITYGKGGIYTAKHIKYNKNKLEFDVYKHNKFYLKINLNLIGTYNLINALCAVTVCDYYKIEKEIIKKGLINYGGVKRRYEYMGKLQNNIVITDYAHHPTQIKNCINATKGIYSRPITVVYEPHTYTRTQSLFAEFISSLSIADNIIILPTYSAREKVIKGATSKNLYKALKFKEKNIKYIKSYDNCIAELEKLNNNVILILGAGSVVQIAEKIKQNYLTNNQN